MLNGPKFFRSRPCPTCTSTFLWIFFHSNKWCLQHYQAYYKYIPREKNDGNHQKICLCIILGISLFVVWFQSVQLKFFDFCSRIPTKTMVAQIGTLPIGLRISLWFLFPRTHKSVDMRNPFHRTENFTALWLSRFTTLWTLHCCQMCHQCFYFLLQWTGEQGV